MTAADSLHDHLDHHASQRDAAEIDEDAGHKTNDDYRDGTER